MKFDWKKTYRKHMPDQRLVLFYIDKYGPEKTQKDLNSSWLNRIAIFVANCGFDDPWHDGFRGRLAVKLTHPIAMVFHCLLASAVWIVFIPPYLVAGLLNWWTWRRAEKIILKRVVTEPEFRMDLLRYMDKHYRKNDSEPLFTED